MIRIVRTRSHGTGKTYECTAPLRKQRARSIQSLPHIGNDTFAKERCETLKGDSMAGNQTKTPAPIFLASLSIPLLLTGCIAIHWRDGAGKIQHRGALHYSIMNTPTAQIFVQETVGLDLRLASYDPGMSLGYRKYIAVQPKPDGLDVAEHEGYFRAEDPVTDHAGLYFKKVYGSDLGFNSISNGLTLGYDRITLIVGPKTNESVTSKIEFSEDDLPATLYLYQQGGF